MLNLREAERVVGDERAALERLNRILQIVHGAGRRREVKHIVHRRGDLDWLRDVMFLIPKARIAPEMFDVRQRAGDEIVDAHHFVAAGEKERAWMSSAQGR